MTLSEAERAELGSLSARFNAAFERTMRDRDGAAAQRQWSCEDGWLVVYTTSRIVGGPHDGRFATMLYRPEGKGARSGKAARLSRTYLRAYSTRKAAKARALQLYRQHSPTWAARHPG